MSAGNCKRCKGDGVIVVHEIVTYVSEGTGDPYDIPQDRERTCPVCKGTGNSDELRLRDRFRRWMGAGFGAWLVILLVACSPISSGFITSKVHTDDYYYTTMICASYGKYGCTVWIPVLNHQPDTWRFELENNDQTGWVYVDEPTYDAYEVGQVYNS